MFTFLTRTFSTVVSILKWGILCACVSGAVLAVVVYYHLDTELERLIKTDLQSRYPHLRVAIGSAQMQESKGVFVRRLQFFETEQTGRPNRLVFEAEEVFVEVPITLPSLLQGDRDVRKISLFRPKLHLSVDENGKIREPRLLTPAPVQTPTPLQFPIHLSAAQVLFDGSKVENAATGETAILTGLDVWMTPPSPLQESLPDGAWTFGWETTGEFLGHSKGNGFFVPETQQWWTSGMVRNVQWSPPCAELLDPLLATNANDNDNDNDNRRDWLRGFRAVADAEFEVHSDATAPLGVRFHVQGKLLDGRIATGTVFRQQLGESGDISTDRRRAASVLTNPVTDLAADFRVTEDTVDVKNLTARIGTTQIAVSYRQLGLSPFQSAVLLADFKELRLDSEILRWGYPFCTQKIREFFEDVDFSGTASAHVDLRYDGNRWKPYELDFQIHEISLEYEKFPYPLEHLMGTLTLTPNEQLSFHLQEIHSVHNLHIYGNYEQLFQGIHGKLKIVGKDVAIDEKLLSVLARRNLHAILALYPQGHIDADLTISLPPPSENSTVVKHFIIVPKNCSVEYSKFPYPLRNITGRIVMANDVWRLEKLTGTNESANVVGSGQFATTSAGHELILYLQAKGLPLDGDIKKAILDPNKLSLLTSLQAKGKVDLNAQIQFYPQQERLEMKFDADLNSGKDPISIHPQQFPCRIEQVRGRLQYDNGNVTIRQFSGRNRDMQILSDVGIQFSPDGSWQLSLSPLAIFQLPPSDRELRKTLPENVQTLLADLQLGGPVNLLGNVEIAKGNRQDSPMKVDWNVGVTLFRNSLNFTVPVTNICGQIYHTGTFVEKTRFETTGRLELDSVMVGDVQMTDVTGPFVFDGQKLLLGDAATAVSYKPENGGKLAAGNGDFVYSQNRSDRFSTSPENTGHFDGVPSPFPAAIKFLGQSPQYTAIPYTAIPMYSTPPLSPPLPPTRAVPANTTPPSDTLPPLTLPSVPTLPASLPLVSLPSVQTLPPVPPPQPTLPVTSPQFRRSMLAEAASTPQITARVFGGTLRCHGWVRYDSPFIYRLNIALNDADLGRAVFEMTPGADPNQKLNGQLSMHAEFGGTGGRKDTIGGFGSVALRNANIYESPWMLQLLQILSIQPPQQSAFSASDVDFRITGNNVVLDKVELRGTLLGLSGAGEMRVDTRTVNMILSARMAKSRLPFLTEILSGAGDQLTRIQVEGPLTGEGPRITQIPFPGVRNVLETMQQP